MTWHLFRLEKARFALVGIINTALDFGIYNLLAVGVGAPTLLANTISTGAAMVFSFGVNRKWTFHSKSTHYARDITLFVIFTIIGMWGINNGIVWMITNMVPLDGLSDFWKFNSAKVVATAASMTWNYLAYKHVVFRSMRKDVSQQ